MTYITMSLSLVLHFAGPGRLPEPGARVQVTVLSASNHSNDTRSGPGFTQTRWTQVVLAERDQSPAARQALEELCARYWPSLYTYLRRRGYRPHDAEDLTQGFLTQLLETRSIARADPAKGRFRSFLLGSLQHDLVDETRKQAALKRGGPGGLEALPFQETEEQYLAEPDPGLTPEEAFDRRWAASLMEKAFGQLEAEFAAEGPGERFQHLKRFIAEEASETDCAELGARLGIAPKSASMAVYRLRRRYHQLVRDEVLAIMDHPHIARGFDAGATESGRPYFVMELVPGIKITEFCDENHLSTRERLDLFIKVCQAIQHAHQKRVMHRDIKPSNVLVTLHDDQPVPKVIDFGIAKATEGRLTEATVYTQLQQFLGTPAYMSPEQARMGGLDIDTRSDIYSLGVLLYELLTGRPPFEAKELRSMGLEAMCQTIWEREPLRPSTRLRTLQREELTTTAQRRAADVPALPHLLRGDRDWIVMECLERDRKRRYETVNGLAADLQRHLHNEPVVARPPTAAYRFQKAYRRNQGTFAAWAAVLAALTIGLIVAL